MSEAPQNPWFVFRGNELLVFQTAGTDARVPMGEEWAALSLPAEEPQAVGTLNGRDAWAARIVDDAAEPPEGMAFQGLRRLWGALDEETWKLAGRAAQIVEWDRNHRFCGRCGAGTERKPAELARVCPRCGLQQFPRISPAVIVRIERGDQLLLARSPISRPASTAPSPGSSSRANRWRRQSPARCARRWGSRSGTSAISAASPGRSPTR